jgi:malate synthase
MPEPNQMHNLREDVSVTAADLLKVPSGDISEEGVRANIRVGIQYVEAWLCGNGCVPLYHLMEDAATAEISRAQLWQWIRHEAKLNDGSPITTQRFENWLTEELNVIQKEIGIERYQSGKFSEAADLFSEMIHKEAFDEFLTIPAYNQL